AAVQSWDVNDLPGPPQKCLPEVSGMARADLGSFLELVVPCGTCTANGQVAENHLWVFLPLDGDGRVKGHYFLTLAELADDEKARRGGPGGGRKRPRAGDAPPMGRRVPSGAGFTSPAVSPPRCAAPPLVRR